MLSQLILFCCSVFVVAVVMSQLLFFRFIWKLWIFFVCLFVFWCLLLFSFSFLFFSSSWFWLLLLNKGTIRHFFHPTCNHTLNTIRPTVLVCAISVDCLTRYCFTFYNALSLSHANTRAQLGSQCAVVCVVYAVLWFLLLLCCSNPLRPCRSLTSSSVYPKRIWTVWTVHVYECAFMRAINI